MRILLDISVLGLGHVFPEMRGGTFRVHEHLAEGLARSGECELFLCANYSSVAFVGCADYVHSSPVLRALPLIGPAAGGNGGRGGGTGRRVGRLARAVHRAIRPLFPGRVIPASLRDLAQGVDRKLHPPVSDVPPGVDVFHSLGARLPPPPLRSPRRLVNIYDLAPLRHPHLYGDNQRFLAKERIAGLQREDWVITTSEATRTDLAELAGVDPQRVFVIPLAADPRIFHPHNDAYASRIEHLRKRLGIGDGPYLLALNAHELRKNMDAAIRAFTRAVAEGGARDLTLVIAGPASAEPGIQSALAEAAQRQARVILAGYVTDEDLAALYGGSLAFVYPSLCEGFGLPPLEAMQCGTPVIAGRVASLPEVVGDAGVLVDLADPDALSAAMLRLCRDAALRERLCDLSLARAATFSWERCTRETLAAYRAVMAGTGREVDA
jgi:glycosyltransferase involved in cell wall biosynthesis